jgi:hypothetical protein
VLDPGHDEHLIIGTDAGIYESWDEGLTWRHFPNLPVSQFYKLALDNSEPFYNLLGGAQDLGTLHGPSRTTNSEGVRNQDWYVPLGADGYACAFDPEQPDLAYMEIQVGSLHRYDRRSHELVDIRPVPEPGDPPERWNWDAPLLISPHSPARLYYGSQRLWRSDDRGNSWKPVSGDLTLGRNRYELEMAGRVHSVDALYDNGAMSIYATTTTISESPLVEGLLYVGTDDGLIRVSEDGGATWRRAGRLPGVPELSFVNDLQASLHDPDTVYAAIDAHKLGDYRPLLFESTNRGKSWTSIAGDLPERTIVWAIEQDHVVEELLFAGTEFGLYFSPDHGRRWLELAGAPTIPFRDVELQRRDSDLVGASFGRGFYVLDDYGPLRELAAALEGEAALFPVRDAWWYVPSVPGQARGLPTLGSTLWVAPNPPFGAVFTYFVRDVPKTSKEQRSEREELLRESGDDVPFPGWERLRAERLEGNPRLLLTVRDTDGTPLRRLSGPTETGVHRVAWDLRLPAPDALDLDEPGFVPPWVDAPQGPLAPPGRYRVELALLSGDGLRPLGQPREFEVKPVPSSFFPEPDYAEVAAFQRETADLLRRAAGAAAEVRRTEERVRYLREALKETPAATAELSTRIDGFVAALDSIKLELFGDPDRRRLNEAGVPSVLGRVRGVAGAHWQTRQAPTETQRRSLEIARSRFASLSASLKRLIETDLAAIEAGMEAAGAPWTPGRPLPEESR